MKHEFLADFSTPSAAKIFRACLFRETARIARIEGSRAIVAYRTKTELERIGKVARMFN